MWLEVSLYVGLMTIYNINYHVMSSVTDCVDTHLRNIFTTRRSSSLKTVGIIEIGMVRMSTHVVILKN